MFFIDESGSIPKFRDTRWKYRYFVVGFIQTQQPRKVASTYKRAIRNLRKHFPEFFASLQNPNEMKGSEAHPFMKLYILEKLLKSTDIRIGHMVVNTLDIEDVFRSKPSRSFNYLVKIIMENFSLSSSEKQNLELIIDNRNTAIKNLKSLEDYLYNELVLENRMTNNVSVKYVESSDNYNIQVADLISNTIYQRFRYKGLLFPNFDKLGKNNSPVCNYTYEYLYQVMKPRICTPFVFPPSSKLYKEAAATYQL
jgi:hypothetical protein